MTRDEYLADMRSNYKRVEVTPDGEGYVGYYRLLFHWTIIRGHLDDLTGYDYRWCIAEEMICDEPSGGKLLVEVAFDEWQSRGFDGHPKGWHRFLDGVQQGEHRRPKAEMDVEKLELLAHFLSTAPEISQASATLDSGT